MTGRLMTIDPGTTESAYVILDERNWIEDAAIVPNEELVALVAAWDEELAIEKIVSYGQIAGQSLFETCVWSGRMIQAYRAPDEVIRVPRGHVKKHLCHSTAAKDSNVRARLLDLWGPKGIKARPGPTYLMSKDKWAALGVAATVREIEDPIEWPPVLTISGILA